MRHVATKVMEIHIPEVNDTGSENHDASSKQEEDDNHIDEGSTELKVLKKSPICPWIFGHHKVTVEPVIFLSVFSVGLGAVVLQHFILIRTCRVTMNYNATICNKMEINVSSVPEYERKTQPPTTTLMMINGILPSIIPAVLSLFLGPWSDKYGRKLLLIWPLFAYTAHFTLLTLMALVTVMHPYFLLLANVPVIFSGGFMALFASSAALITDITTPERRSLRMGIFDICNYLGFFLGMFSSGFVKEALGKQGYFIVFVTCAGIFLLCLLYVIFMLPESVPIDDNFKTTIRNARKLFDFHLLADTMSICFKKRQNCHRGMIIMQTIVMATGNMVHIGEMSVLYYYTRIKFGWNITDYTVFFGTAIVIIVAGTLFGVTVFSSILHLDDLLFIIVALITRITVTLIFALSPYSWCLYLGAGVLLFSGVTMPLSRSFISKNIPQEIVGVIFTVASAVESLLPAASGPLYINVYNATAGLFPGTFFFISTTIFTIDLVLTCTVKSIHYKHQRKGT